MRAPLSEEDVRSMLDDRPERTQTQPTSREVIAVIPADSKVELRTRGDDETKQLADYLGVDPSEPGARAPGSRFAGKTEAAA